jgi:hypothetical protein
MNLTKNLTIALGMIAVIAALIGTVGVNISIQQTACAQTEES